jgi:ferric-dicitrate binding protein FerR (iron transport regulator)
MDHLMFRSLKRQTTPSEEEALLEWRRSAPENEAAYRELAQLLSAVTQGAEAGRPDAGPAPRAADLLAAARGGDATLRPAGTRAARNRPWSRSLTAWLPGGIAAAVVLALVVLRPAPEPEPSLAFGADEFQTGTNDVATISLRDGTVIRLAPQSRLRVTGSLGAREVTLDGRAFFAVPRIDGDPFTVRSQAGDVVVLGTRFDAEARGDEIKLLVVEGLVALSAAQERIEVGAGEMGRAVHGAMSLPVRVEDPYGELAWMGDFLVFQRTPIERVAVEIERHFGMRVEVLGNDLDRLTVTASFTDADADDVLGIVCRVLTAECSIAGDHATIDLTHDGQTPRRSLP